MTLSPAILERIAVDLAERVEGGRLQKLRQPRPETLILELRVPGETIQLLLCAQPGMTRIHVTQEKWPNAPTPPAFLQRARKELSGTKLQFLELEGPTLSIGLARSETHNAFDGTWVLRLTHDPQRPTLELQNPQGHCVASLQGKFQASPEALRLTDRPGGTALHEQIESHYREEEGNAVLSTLRRATSSSLTRAIKREKRRQKKIQGDLEKAQSGTQYTQWGELLKSHLHAVDRGAKEARVPDYSLPNIPTVTVPLDPARDAKSNMERYFHQGRRLNRAVEQITKRLTEAEKQLQHLQKAHETANEATTIEELESLLREFPPKLFSRQLTQEQRTKRAQKALPFREYRTRKGMRVLVGRNAKCNDRLTFQVARGNDIWLHARGRRGAHVIVPQVDRTFPSPDCLADAARLCAYFSEGGKTDSGVEVWWVLRKHLRKPSGAPPGTVTYSGGKSVWIKHDAETTRLLLNTELFEE